MFVSRGVIQTGSHRSKCLKDILECGNYGLQLPRVSSVGSQIALVPWKEERMDNSIPAINDKQQILVLTHQDSPQNSHHDSSPHLHNYSPNMGAVDSCLWTEVIRGRGKGKTEELILNGLKKESPYLQFYKAFCSSIFTNDPHSMFLKMGIFILCLRIACT